jgi:acyl-coenzyme A thioesterase PaaI-like protein
LTSETLARLKLGTERATPARRDRESAFDFEPHHCFACGELNEQGLHLAIHTDPQGSWTETTLDQRFQGWEAVAHGGIVCTLLDEVMAWSVIGRGTWGVTARLNVAFRQPIPVGRAIRAVGWVVDENRRAHRTAGQVLDVASGEVLATGEATFMAVPPEEVDRLKARYGMRRLGDEASGQTAGELTGREDGPSDRRRVARRPAAPGSTPR